MKKRAKSDLPFLGLEYAVGVGCVIDEGFEVQLADAAASAVTSKPPIEGHFKTGQNRPSTDLRPGRKAQAKAQASFVLFGVHTLDESGFGKEICADLVVPRHEPQPIGRVST
ncbi:MAG: hypothetical protein DMG57_39220 [Acidobacteria bacterium]|nr:MAG: hypothetical protein DMG57_39220 [Acidobacteriota bacterium]